MKLRSKTPLIYDARNLKAGTIELHAELTEKDGGLEVAVTDYLEKTRQDGGTYLWEIGEGGAFLPKEKVNQMYAAIAANLPTDMPYTEREEKVRQIAFLKYVQGDLIDGKTIYGGAPAVWEIKTENGGDGL